MTKASSTATKRDTPPLATITHGIDSAWHGIGGWLDDVVRMQQETLRYLHRRVERELDAVAHATSCRHPIELVDLQLCYASQALADGIALGLRLTALVNGSARRRYRRAVARRHGKPAA